jgi:NhaP-type Na+/H+ or K+/H+ antiporter
MLFGGIIASNSMHFIVKQLIPEWSMIIRRLALTMIMIRAGLKVNIYDRVYRSHALLRLLLIPPLIETNLAAVLAYAIWDMPWVLGYALGFMLSGVAPAAIIPACIKLRNEGYGIDKGIPNLLIIASSIDSITSVVGFGIFIDLYTYSAERAMEFTIISSSEVGNTFLIVFIEIVGGVLIGIFLGLLYSRMIHSYYKFQAATIYILSSITVIAFNYIGNFHLGFINLGFISTILSCSIASSKWGHIKSEKTEDYLASYWIYIQIALLGLIGALIYFPDYDATVVGYSILIVSSSILLRINAAALSILRTRTNWKEKLFVGVTWICKTPVQAALGTILLTVENKTGAIEEDPSYGMIFLTVAVMCILISGPFVAFLIGFLGPRLLKKSQKPSVEIEENLLKVDAFPHVKESDHMSPHEIEFANEQLYQNMCQELSSLLESHSRPAELSPIFDQASVRRPASISETLKLMRCRQLDKREGYKSD